ncbi:hypothetical protein [Gimesia maris]|uniref:hypothetical protein n=1 Tax=Gimesia maris TaxID=122 RepID=UPI003A92846F
MSNTVNSPIADYFTVPWWNIPKRLKSWKQTIKPATRLGILRAAERGKLDIYLLDRYVIYYCPSWQSCLKVCSDLQKDGLLEMELEEYYDGMLLSNDNNARITQKGLDYLTARRRWYIGTALAVLTILLKFFA